MQNPIISNIWTVSRCVFEAVEGEKRKAQGSFQDEGGWAVFVAGELKTAGTTDNHNQHLPRLLGCLALGYWHGQLDLLEADHNCLKS